MGGSPFYDPFPSYYSPPSRPRPPRSVITVPVSYPSSPLPLPRLPSIHPSAAATTIQSRFRGFSVRRRTPLVHLRTVASVRRQLDLLHSEMQRPDFATAICGNEKERLKFTESVMALLLQLDAVEGAIPEIRDRRKQATRKAIQLQDAIDAISQESEPELKLVQEFGDAVADDGKNEEIRLQDAIDAISQESEPELKLVQKFGDAIADDGKNEEILSGAADDILVDLARTDGQNSPALSVDPNNSDKTSDLVSKLTNDSATADDRSRTCDVRMEAMLQGTEREQMATPQYAESCTADNNNSEEIRRSFQQVISALPAQSVNLENNHGMEKMWEDNCTTENDRGGSGDDSIPAIGDDVGNHDVKVQSVHLCTGVGQRAEKCTDETSIESTNFPHSVAKAPTTDNDFAMGREFETLETINALQTEKAEKSYSDQAAADMHVSSTFSEGHSKQSSTSLSVSEAQSPDRTERPGELQRKSENREIEQLKLGACEKVVLSSEITIQKVPNVENGMPVVRATESLASTSLPQEEEPRVADRVLLEQLAEDCKHMKCLLTRLYDQRRLQNKIIDSLNNRVERLEHLTHRQQTKNRKQNCAKHNHRKDKLTARKSFVSHDGQLQLWDTSKSSKEIDDGVD